MPRLLFFAEMGTWFVFMTNASPCAPSVEEVVSVSTVNRDTGARYAVELPGANTANKRAGAPTAEDLAFVHMGGCNGGVINAVSSK